jgi:hypothetical protein
MAKKKKDPQKRKKSIGALTIIGPSMPKRSAPVPMAKGFHEHGGEVHLHEEVTVKAKDPGTGSTKKKKVPTLPPRSSSKKKTLTAGRHFRGRGMNT